MIIIKFDNWFITLLSRIDYSGHLMFLDAFYIRLLRNDYLFKWVNNSRLATKR